MNENAINDETLRYDVLNNKTIKKEKLIETKLFISQKFTISKIHKNFTICVTRMWDEEQTHMHPSQPLSPTTTQWLGKHHTLHAQYTLANSNLHQPLISFLYVIPSCKQY